MSHTLVLPPPCLTHNPLTFAAVVQSLNVQIFLAPCFWHSPSLTAPALHPAVEQNPLAPCAQQSPRAATPLLQSEVEQVALSLECFIQRPFFPFAALVLHRQAVQIPCAPCLVQTPLPSTRGVLQLGSAQATFLLCFLQWLPFFRALVTHPIVTHLPFAPCLPHTPLAFALAVQLSTEHGFP
jgi:hypothetical protein